MSEELTKEVVVKLNCYSYAFSLPALASLFTL